MEKMVDEGIDSLKARIDGVKRIKQSNEAAFKTAPEASKDVLRKRIDVFDQRIEELEKELAAAKGESPAPAEPAKAPDVDVDSTVNVNAPPAAEDKDDEELADATNKVAKGEGKIADAISKSADASKNDAKPATDENAFTKMVDAFDRSVQFARGASGEQNIPFIIPLLLFTFLIAVFDFLRGQVVSVNYEALFSMIKGGGIDFVIRLMIPVYVVVIMLVYLIIYAAKAQDKKKLLWVMLIIIGGLSIANFIGATYGVTAIPWIGVSLSWLVLMVSMVLASMNLDPKEQKSIWSWFFWWVTIFSAVSFNLHMNLSGLLHLGAAFMIWLLVLHKPGEQWGKANYIFISLFWLDFFLLGLFVSFFPPGIFIANRFIFPLWFLFLVFYAGQNDSSVWTKWLMGIVALFYILALVDGAYGFATLSAQVQSSPEQVAEARSFFKDGLSKIKNIFPEMIKQFRKGMEEATGGYYNGKVEENQDPRNELGVHIVNLKAADKRFYENEEVTVWGDLKAKTLDDPIYVYMSCKARDKKGEIVPKGLANKDYLKDPNKGYKIDRLEEIPFECRFKPGMLNSGVNSVEVSVEFNFKTLAYLKTYFMDIERIRALRRDNIDPLKQYGVVGKPEARFTNGPVKIGMGTVDPPIGLSVSSGGFTYVGVTIEPQWFGRVKNITRLEIQVPKELSITDDEDRYCRGWFEKIGDGIEGYDIFNMTPKEIGNLKVPIEAGSYVSRRCTIDIGGDEINDILGDTPLGVYNYRANVDYVYEIKKSTSVSITPVSGEKRLLWDCGVECDDNDDCICNVGGCGAPKGTEIRKGETCNNTGAAQNTLRNFKQTHNFIKRSIKTIDGYLALNELCFGGYTTDMEKRIDESELSKEQKSELKQLLEKCTKEETRLDYVQPMQDKIVEKVIEVRIVFDNALMNLRKEMGEVVKSRTMEYERRNFINKIKFIEQRFKEDKKKLTGLRSREEDLKRERESLENSVFGDPTFILS